MFRNYVVTALRNMERNWLYTAISIVGLAVAFTAAILITQFVRNEFSYDRWIPGYQQVYKITDVTQPPAQPPSPSDLTQSAIAGQLKANFSGATAVARLFVDRPVLRHRPTDAGVLEGTFAWADPDFFKVLSLPAFAGAPSAALRQADTVVLTRRMARKYFGRDVPIGDTLDVQIGDAHHPMRVAAVLKDLPSNTVLTTEIFASSLSAYSRSVPLDAQPQMGLLSCETYVRLAPNETAQSLQSALDVAGRPEMAHYASQVGGTKFTFSAMPLAKLHLHAPGLTTPTAKPSGDTATAYAIGAVGALIVLVASINFVSLMTARAARRAVEVGVRKAAGAHRADLVVQFIGEALIYVAISMLIAAGSAESLLRPFGAFLRRELSLDFVRDPLLSGAVVGAALLIGILGGLYPALVLSSFRPATVLKGGVVQTSGSNSARQALIVVQFAILIGLIVTTATLYRQTQFALSKGLGGADSNLIVEVPTPCNNAFPDEVRRLPGVRSAACASMNAVNSLTWKSVMLVEGANRGVVNLDWTPVDFGFFQVFDVRPLAGRLFDRSFGRDGAMVKPGSMVWPSVILNEAGARALGYASPQAAVGHAMIWRGRAVLSASGGSPPNSPIVGVIPDLPATVRATAEPTFYIIGPRRSGMLSIKLTGQDVPGTVRAIERTWRATGNNQPISEVFLAQSRQTQYLDLIIQGAMMGVCSVIAVLLSCLGLFALCAFTTEHRTKEIGIRKAMGATTSDVVKLLLWQFTAPVLWAIAIALPIGAVIMNYWLRGFVYHVGLAPWIFLVSAGATLVIAWLTVSYQSFMVARAKPVTALRYE